MRTRSVLQVLLVTLLALSLAGCGVIESLLGEEEPTEVPTQAAAVAPSATPEPEPTAVPEPTAQPEPTAEPEPTSAPEPTAVPEPTQEPEPTTEPEPSAEPEPTEAEAQPRPTRPKGIVPGPRTTPTEVEVAEPTAGPTVPPRPTREPEPAVDDTVTLSDLVPLEDLDSFVLQTYIEAYATGDQGYIDASREYTRDPYAERVFVLVEVEDDDPTSLEMVRVDGTTYIDEDESGDWEEDSAPLDETLADFDLAWMVDPIAILGDAVLEHDGDDGEYAHYVTDASILSESSMFEDYDLEGLIEIWVDTDLQVVSEILADVAGVDDFGETFEMYYDLYVSEVNTDFVIEAPGEQARPVITSDWPDSLDLSDLSQVEDLDSYRLYIYVLQDSPDEFFSAEILREYSGVPGEERLAMSAWMADERAFIDMIQDGDTTYIDDGTGSGWQDVDGTIEDNVDLASLLPGEALASLSGVEGNYGGEEWIRDMPAVLYSWDAEDLEDELDTDIVYARADVWVSQEFGVPLEIQMTVEGEDTLMLVQYVATDLDEDIYIPSPDESCCENAEGLLLNDYVEGEIEAGESVCYKFIALEGEYRTLDVDTFDPEVDLDLSVYDGECYWAHYNDDGPEGWDPLLSFAPYQSGVYYAEIEGLSDIDEGEFALYFSLFDDSISTLADAVPIEPGDTIAEAITDEDLLYLVDYEETYYADVYSFEGREGDDVTVTVLAEMYGSDFDPLVTLLDPDMDWLMDDDDSYGGLDSLLEYELDETGTHYLVVLSATATGYGGTDDFFYELTLEVD